MEISKIENFTKGWFVGDFQPTAFSTQNTEVAVKTYRAGEYEPAHYHKVATELTVILTGRVRMSGREIGPGSIVKIFPGEATDFQALQDVTTVVVKVPCVKNDKYNV